MGTVFGKSKAPPPADPSSSSSSRPAASVINDRDRAILQLKVQKDRLHKYTVKIQLVIQREIEVAKELLAKGKKQNAILALKRKRYQEQLLTRTEGEMLNLESLVQSIEFASMQSEVFQALKQGNEVLTLLNEQTSLTDVERLMEDTHEAVEYQSKVSEMLSGPAGAEVDMDEVMKTISMWEKEENQDNVVNAPRDEAAIIDQLNDMPQANAKIPVTVTAKPAKAKQKPALVLASWHTGMVCWSNC